MNSPILEMLRPDANWSTDAETRRFLMYLIAFRYEPLASDDLKIAAQEVIDNAHMGLYGQAEMEERLIDLYADEFGNLEF